MLWYLAGFVTFLGFGMWLVGNVKGYAGVAMIGAAIVIGAGAIVTHSGLQYKAGETQITQSANQTVTNYQYNQIDTPQQLSIGGLWMLFGGLLAIHQLNEIA